MVPLEFEKRPPFASYVASHLKQRRFGDFNFSDVTLRHCVEKMKVD